MNTRFPLYFLIAVGILACSGSTKTSVKGDDTGPDTSEDHSDSKPFDSESSDENDDDPRSTGASCSDDMNDGMPPDPSVVRINFAAASCDSKLCIQYGVGEALCTRPCDSASDCPESTADCRDGFVCVVGQAVSGGDLGCCRLCVCQSHLDDPDVDPQAAACEGRTATCPNI